MNTKKNLKYQILVNKNNPLPKDWDNFVKYVKIIKVDDTTSLLEKETYKQFCKLQKFIKKKGIEIGISSAHRTIEYQQEVYDKFVKEYGKKYADTVVAPIGTSEHHTGLAVDINIFDNNHWQETNHDFILFEDTFKMIHQYLHLFGFILRYPNGKEDITGYPYESWHFRYVGKDIAKEIYINKWTLEEYHKNKNIEKFL